MSLQLVRYVLMAAMRDRMVWGIVAISVLGVCLSVFSGSAAVIEQDQFVITYLAGGLRLLSLIGLALFVVFYVRRSYDARDIEFLLTRPVSRGQFVTAHGVAFSLLAIFTGVFLALILAGFSFQFGYKDGFPLWALGVTFEYILVVNVAFFFAMVLSSPVTAGLATLGFYVLSRMTGELLSIAQSPQIEGGGQAFLALSVVMKVVSVIIPRFDLMAETSWLIYGGVDFHNWIFVIVQAVVFLALVLSATAIDLKRRQF
ncbi:MAG TPA: ABC transporter permease subunit [Alphaproteobacteria bacterium]|nr:ABC transporter permease subunit [Alphaproteobacteria bacterium]HNS44638.1 ABC transporter permease subunit [Alphaproteobacteria bacterium]